MTDLGAGTSAKHVSLGVGEVGGVAPAPTWATCGAVSKQLPEKLASHGARELIDTEAFLYVGTPAPRRKR